MQGRFNRFLLYKNDIQKPKKTFHDGKVSYSNNLRIQNSACVYFNPKQFIKRVVKHDNKNKLLIIIFMVFFQFLNEFFLVKITSVCSCSKQRQKKYFTKFHKHKITSSDQNKH